MKEHHLKTDPDVFFDVWEGRKKFELRRDDGRNFQVGDLLILEKTKYSAKDMKDGLPLEYTGVVHHMRVNYILRGPAYGLPEGFVIMS